MKSPQTTLPEVITAEEAALLLMQPLTTPFSEFERWKLENVVRDLRGESPFQIPPAPPIQHALVSTPDGLEVWRAGMKHFDSVPSHLR